MTRAAEAKRVTKETEVTIRLRIEGDGIMKGGTGIAFFDHLLASMIKHSGFDLELNVRELVHVDDHHVVEDVALVLGYALRKALGDKKGIMRFGHAIIPMDDSLSMVAIDLSGRPYLVFNADFSRNDIGGMALENIRHFFRSLATSSCSTIHALVLHGVNDHHKAESLFKALGVALREAVSLSGKGNIPSLKGVL